MSQIDDAAVHPTTLFCDDTLMIVIIFKHHLYYYTIITRHKLCHESKYTKKKTARGISAGAGFDPAEAARGRRRSMSLFSAVPD